jgi:hypothetical protein
MNQDLSNEPKLESFKPKVKKWIIEMGQSNHPDNLNVLFVIFILIYLLYGNCPKIGYNISLCLQFEFVESMIA